MTQKHKIYEDVGHYMWNDYIEMVSDILLHETIKQVSDRMWTRVVDQNKTSVGLQIDRQIARQVLEAVGMDVRNSNF